LRKAEDAVVLDTTALSLPEVTQTMAAYIQDRASVDGRREKRQS
jgi:cytidylate kinase